MDYEERESEFDVEDEDKSVKEDAEEQDLDVEVDVTNKNPIPAFCRYLWFLILFSSLTLQYIFSSDEEDDDPSALLYLPVAPDIEEPEDGFIGGEEGESPAKRGSDQKENSSPKKKRTKTTEISLEGAPTDEVHPLLAKGGGKDKGGSKKPQGRPAKDKGKGKNK